MVQESRGKFSSFSQFRAALGETAPDDPILTGRICRYEPPGCRHRVSDNASKTERALLLATFVIKTEVLEKEGHDVLVQVEPEYLTQMQQKL